MGILVPQATLPDGNVVSNVYISFFPETIHCFSRMGTVFEYRAMYHVYKDVSDIEDTWKFELSVETEDPSDKPPFVFMYEALKKLYPGSTDHFENRFPPIEPF